MHPKNKDNFTKNNKENFNQTIKDDLIQKLANTGLLNIKRYKLISFVEGGY